MSSATSELDAVVSLQSSSLATRFSARAQALASFTRARPTAASTRLRSSSCS